MADILFTQIPNESLRTGTDLVSTSGRDTLGIAPGRYVCDALASASLQSAHPRFVARSSNGRYFRALPEAGQLTIELGGTKGDGVIDDGPAIRAAFAYASAIGARGVRFGSASYRMEQMTAAEGTFTGPVPSMLLQSGPAIYNGSGATFSRLGGGSGIYSSSLAPGAMIDLPLAADVVAGSRQLTLASGLGSTLAIGSTVLWQLGELPYDTPETLNWDLARITAISGDTVTLDRPIPEGLSLASVTGPNKRLRKTPVLRDCVIQDLTLASSGQENGIYLYAAERVTLDRIGARNMGAGLIVAQYCDGLTIRDCWQEGSVLTQASYGPAFNFAECRNIVLERPSASNTLSLINAEAGAKVSVFSPSFKNTIVDAAGASRGTAVVLFNALGRASISVHDLTVTGFGGYRLAETSNGIEGFEGVVHFSGITSMRHPTAPFSVPIETMSGRLDMTIGGIREIYDFDRIRPWKRRFSLRDGEYLNAFGPPGLLVRARASTSPGLTVGAAGQLPGFWVGRNGDNGFNIAQGAVAQLVPGQDVRIPCYAGEVGGPQWSLRGNPFKLLCQTATAAGLNAANEFVEFEGWFAQPFGTNFTIDEAEFRSEGSDSDPFEALFPAYDLPNVASGASLSIELAIPDMTSGDFIEAVRISGGLGGLELRDAAALAGKVRLTFTNPSAIAIDRAATDLGVAFSRSIVGT